MNSFVLYPDEGGPHPVVLFHMDAPGKREVLHDMARRLASVGYCMSGPFLVWAATQFPQRGAIYNRTAAERHWERLFRLFDRALWT